MGHDNEDYILYIIILDYSFGSIIHLVTGNFLGWYISDDVWQYYGDFFSEGSLPKWTIIFYHLGGIDEEICIWYIYTYIYIYIDIYIYIQYIYIYIYIHSWVHTSYYLGWLLQEDCGGMVWFASQIPEIGWWVLYKCRNGPDRITCLYTGHL